MREILYWQVVLFVIALGAILLLLATANAQQTSDCPSENLKQCFQCTGQETTYSCCFDPSSPTGQVCVVEECEDPTPVDCPEAGLLVQCNADKQALEQINQTLQTQVGEWQTKATHPNGQLYSEHWGACKTTVFQLWYALHGTTP